MCYYNYDKKLITFETDLVIIMNVGNEIYTALHDKVTFTCTTARKVGHASWKDVVTSHRRFSFIFFCKRCFDESFRFISNRSISVSFLKH